MEEWSCLKNLSSRDDVVIHEAVKEEKTERNFYSNILFKPAFCHFFGSDLLAIFLFLWISDEESLNYFIQFAEDFSEKSNMKLKIKLDANIYKIQLFFLMSELFLTLKLLKQPFSLNLDAFTYI